MTPPTPANDDRSIPLSVMGRIAAGTPIEALQEEINQVSVPTEMLRSGEHYALEVHGDSMIDAGIFDGDTAIIQSTASVDNGDIVVALVEGHEATLKRLRRKAMIALEAANPAFETRIFRADQIHSRSVGRSYPQILSTLLPVIRPQPKIGQPHAPMLASRHGRSAICPISRIKPCPARPLKKPVKRGS